MYRNFFKRIFDLFAAIVIFLLLLPVFILLMLVCAIAFNGKIFFIQPRIGKDEAIFNIIKFITMRPVSPAGASANDDTNRLTKTGRIIRKTSLDELPQLINIIKGEMSFIGPRPLLVQYLPYYKMDEKIRHTVRPGITGLAQVNGRNALKWDERLQLDRDYVLHLSLWMDVKIFFLTLAHMLKPGTVNTDPRSAMEDLDVERKR